MSKNKTTILAEPGKQELFIIREFEAPRELVYQAFTDPKLLLRWLGPCDMKTKIDVLEPGSGGRWRFIHATKDGHEFGFHGVCHEATAPERLIGQKLHPPVREGKKRKAAVHRRLAAKMHKGRKRVGPGS